MDIKIIHEHSVDLDLLPEKAAILDAGCRGLEFTRHFQQLGHNVLAIDIDDLGEENKLRYLRMGLYFHAGKTMVSDDEDPQARHITDVHLFEKGQDVPKIKEGEVYLATIAGCAHSCDVEQFDLIKMDIEGAEFVILQNEKHPIAKQVSVEFHAHCGQSKQQLDHLLKWLGKWYDVHNQVWEERHGCSANYWDILLIAK